MVNVIIIK